MLDLLLLYLRNLVIDEIPYFNKIYSQWEKGANQSIPSLIEPELVNADFNMNML